MNYACIGSRDLNQEQILLCEAIGKLIAKTGHAVITGGAQGADQAFARGGASINASLVYLCLPWPTYGKIPHGVAVQSSYSQLQYELAAKHHPTWDRLSLAVKKLMTRNAAIISMATKVIAYPRLNHGQWTGGTAHGLRIAQAQKIQIIDLSDPETRANVETKLAKHNLW